MIGEARPGIEGKKAASRRPAKPAIEVTTGFKVGLRASDFS
jgi:hypothetical protein